MVSRRELLFVFLSSALPVLASFLVVPFLLEYVGASRYGVMALLLVVVNHLGFLDLGIGRALGQKIASSANADEASAALTVIWTGLTIVFLISVSGGLVSWQVVKAFLPAHLMLDVSMSSELSAAADWLVCLVPAAIMVSTLEAVLQGQHQLRSLSMLSLLNAMLALLLPLLGALVVKSDLPTLLAAVCVGRIFLVMVYGYCVLRPYGVFKLHWPDRRNARELVHFGRWVSLSSVISPIMVTADRFVVGSLMGAVRVAHYTIAFQLAEKMTLVSSTFSTGLFAKFSRQDAGGDRALLAASTLVAALITPLGVIGFFCAKPFLVWWLGGVFADGAYLAVEILIVGFWLNSLATMPYMYLHATKRPHLVAFSHVVELIPYVCFLLLLTKYYGLAGASVAFGVRALLDWVLLDYFSASGFRLIKNSILPGLILMIAFAASVLLTSSARWGAAVVLTLTASALGLRDFWRCKPLLIA